MSTPDTADEIDWRCYRHPDREAGVRCRRCERAICPDCMVTAPVGFQCRDCVKGSGTKVRTARSLRADPYVTMVLIAANLAIFLPSMGSNGDQLRVDFGLFGPLVAEGEWWRIITSGFLHANLLHVGFNMFLLWQLGSMLEPPLGRVRFGVLYIGSLLAGSLGALVLDPNALTVGASGAVFGLMAAAFLFLRSRGVDPMQTGIGGLLLINILLSFRPGISLGGHLGGLVGGLAIGAIYGATDRDRRWVGVGAAVALAVLVAGASLWVAENPF